MAKARILAVDDQLYFRVFLEEMLAEEGYETATASSAEEALTRLGRETFDVVLTDLAMPGLDGCELVRQIRERAPDLEIVVLTSVGDVRTAVEAMKVGATEYLLKPIDRAVLTRALDGLLDKRRMREEHASLLAENLEFMGAVSLYERALGLFATLALEPLADRVIEGLCLETHTHGGVAWLLRPDDPGRLRLVGARGLVRVQHEAEELVLDELPAELEPLRRGTSAAPVVIAEDRGRPALHVPVRQGDRLLGIVRLTDKVDGSDFDELDLNAAEKFAGFAAQSIANALQLRSLERRSFRDPITKAYTRAYFDDVARNELRKAARFGRTFSVIRVELAGATALRGRISDVEFARWLEAMAFQVGRCLRGSDLMATESDSRFCLLLPETDALGAAILKQRMRGALERSEAMNDLPSTERPEVLLASATFPADGAEVEEMWHALESRLAGDRASPLRSLAAAGSGFEAAAEELMAQARPGRAEDVDQIARFLFAEVARRPHERGLLFVGTGASLVGATRDGFESMRGLPLQTEIVLLGNRREGELPGLPVTWVAPERCAASTPFLVYYGEGAPYALLRNENAEADGETSFYHTCDRTLVEHLAFQLGRDLGIPIGD